MPRRKNNLRHKLRRAGRHRGDRGLMAEQLEPRLLLSCSAGITSNTLEVLGSIDSDLIELRLVSGDTSMLEVDCDLAVEGTFAVADFNAISVSGDDGDDTIVIDESNGVFTDVEATTLSGGGGKDSITGGSGGESINGDAGDDTIDAGGGNDSVLGGTGKDVIDGGAGEDDIDGGDNDDQLAGGDGDDTLDGSGGNDLIGGDVLVLPAIPALVLPIAYDMPNGDSGSYTYYDEKYNGMGNNNQDAAPLSGGVGDLTDGYVETQTWNLVEGPEPKDGPYVGWSSQDPVITFHFAEEIEFDTVAFDFEDSGGTGGVNPPTSVVVQGVTYAAGPLNPPGPEPFTITIDISDQITDTIVVQFIRNGWVFASEVTFMQVPQDQVTIGGGTGNDSILGGAGNDSLLGGDGNDMLFGQGDNDVLDGGAGNDSAEGGSGDDTYDEVPGSDDVLIDTGGIDRLNFSAATTGITLDMSIDDGTPQLVDGVNSLALMGTFENLTGSAFNDSVFGNAADNSFDLGAGNDTANGGGGSDTIDGGANNDHLFGGDGNDEIMTGTGDNTVSGGSGADTITGADGNDSIDGDGGNDYLTGTGGDDTINGGSGQDTLFESGDVSVTLTNASLTGHGTDTLSSINKAYLVGGSGANMLDASAFSGSATLIGDAGDDILLGAAGENYIDCGVGNDSAVGGASNDTLIGDAGDDTLEGGAGNDNLDGGTEADQLFGDAGDDTLFGGPGGATDTDTSLGGTGDDRYVLGLENAVEVDRVGEYPGEGDHDVLDFSALMTKRVIMDLTLTGINQNIAFVGNYKVRQYEAFLSENFEDAIGGNWTTFGDEFTGNDADNTWWGMDGSDTFAGGLGTDRVYEEGDQVFTLATDGSGNGSLVGRGTDVLSSVEEAYLVGGGNANLFDASGFQSGPVTLVGAGGNDTLLGGTGDDSINGGSGNDSVDGGAGGDWLRGSAGDDTLNGGAGADKLRGEAGADSLSGGSDDDTLIGGAGNDTVNGGADNDQWTFSGSGLAECFDVDWDTSQLVANRRLTCGGAAEETDVATEVEGLLVKAGGGADYVDATMLSTADLTSAGLDIITVAGGGGGDTLLGSDGPDKLWGEAGNDSLNGGSGDDSLQGKNGDDTLVGGDGTDVMVNKLTGGADWFDVDWNAVESKLVTNRRLSSGGASVDTDEAVEMEALWVLAYAGVDNVDASALDATDLTASGIDVITLQGGAGDDVLIGSDGDDVLLGKAGNDDLSGGDGDDTLDGEAGTDTLDGGGGTDTCTGETESNCEADPPAALENGSAVTSIAAGEGEIFPFIPADNELAADATLADDAPPPADPSPVPAGQPVVATAPTPSQTLQTSFTEDADLFFAEYGDNALGIPLSDALLDSIL